MSELSNSPHLAGALLEAGSYIQSHREARLKGKPEGRHTIPAFTIAFSRETGARGALVAREVGKRLGWPVFDHEILERIAREMKLRTDLLESVDEGRMSWLLETANGFLSSPTVSEPAYVRHLLEIILSLGMHGACVIVGRGAAHILPSATTLRVRLVAALEDRVATLMSERGLTHTAAARHLETVDRKRFQFIRDHFQKDPTDPRNYDLVLNTSRFSVPESAELTLEALGRMQARSGPA